jgi:hypothetical protein
VLKVIYGLLESALLFYKQIRKDLENIGFNINPYDPCVAKLIINGAMLTVTWHVDSMKCPHINEYVVDSFISWLKMKYEDINKVKETRGLVHDYFEMKLNYLKQGKVIVCMKKYVNKMIDEYEYKEEI